jgi:hypothetical protein
MLRTAISSGSPSLLQHYAALQQSSLCPEQTVGKKPVQNCNGKIVRCVCTRQYRYDYENDVSITINGYRRRAYLSAGAQPGKHPGEKVDLKSLPAEVQQTIKEKAAGGTVAKVMREDDPDDNPQRAR